MAESSTHHRSDPDSPPREVMVGLNAVIVAIVEGLPSVFTVTGGAALPMPLADHAEPTDEEALPYGPFDPAQHRTLEIGLRAWVTEQTPFTLGYVEQLYTFGNRGRYSVPAKGAPHFISVGYLALTRAGDTELPANAAWRDWYHYFPWEDWRGNEPRAIKEIIIPHLRDWAKLGRDETRQARRLERARLCFGFDGPAWDDEKVLERYELLYESGLVSEAARDAGVDPHPLAKQFGPTLQFDHRRVLATAISRLRGKIKYRPIVFELMDRTFTLTELQKVVEAMAGAKLHKQNFRRLVEKSGLVEPTGQRVTGTGGRPAETFRFRREAVRERLNPGMKLPGKRERMPR